MAQIVVAATKAVLAAAANGHPSFLPGLPARKHPATFSNRSPARHEAGHQIAWQQRLLTYLLFLKMAHERANRRLNPDTALEGVARRWRALLDADGDELENTYRHTLENLANSLEPRLS